MVVRVAAHPLVSYKKGTFGQDRQREESVERHREERPSRAGKTAVLFLRVSFALT